MTEQPKTILDPRMLLTQLRAALLGYAAMVGAAVVAAALVVIALTIGLSGGGSDGAASDVDVSQDDATAIGFMVGLPFQLAAMGLFGALRVGDGDFGVTISLPLLVLTAVFVWTTYQLARRAERKHPAASTGDRLLSSVLVGLVTAIAVTVVTRLLAMRYEGTTTHATGVALFFGALVVTTLAIGLGRMRESGVRLPAWIHGEYPAAAILWVHQFALWTAVFLPVAFVWTWVQSSFETALTLPVWGLNAAGFGYALGHLSALDVAGSNGFAWDLGVVAACLLILLTLVVAGLTAVAWHLRRDQDSSHLAEPMSWAPMPLAWACAGVLVCLVPMLHGSVIGFGSSIGPAFFTVFILGGWGLAIEAASRYAAPAVVGSLPPRAQTWLSRNSVRTTPAPAPTGETTPRAPLSPEEKRRLRIVGIVIGGLVVAGVALTIAVSVLNSTVFSPKHEAEAYLKAIVDGDVAQAVELGPVDSEASDALLDDDVLSNASARITGFKITDVETQGDQATVSVTLRGLEEGSKASFTLEKHGSQALLFNKWRVSDGGLARSVEIELPEGSDSLTIGSKAVKIGDDSSYWMFPGTYDLNPYGDSHWLKADDSGSVVSPQDSYAYLELPEPNPSDELMEEINSQLDAYLAKCMSSTEVDPNGCPNSTYAGTDVRNVKWTLIQEPTADLSYFDGTFPADLDFSDASAEVTYESDESYGFGAPDWTKQSESVDLYLSGSVDVDGDTVKVSFDNY